MKKVDVSHEKKRKRSILKVSEIFYSIQGESSHSGRPCIFIRLSGCNLNCIYCDSAYAKKKSRDYSIVEILKKVRSWPGRLVEITGGEPLLQTATSELCRRLLQAGYRVLIETNGSLDISTLPKEVVKIIDVKTPGSGSGGSFLFANWDKISLADEIKLVITSKKDFDWAVQFVRKQLKTRLRQVLFSAAGQLPPARLAVWVRDQMPETRFQIQLHKVLWPNRKKGV